MSLSTGRGPLSARRAGRFTAPVPDGVTYIEPFRRRVRAVKDGLTVMDSERVLLVHRPGHPPSYAIAAEDSGGMPSQPLDDAPGYVWVDWAAADAWFEEDEEVFGHPRNPYHRVDSLRSHRHLRVDVGDITLVDTSDTVAVYETALDPRLYVHPSHVRMDVLVRSDSSTYCPYKGTASYWHAQFGGTVVEDAAWSYEDPLPESQPLRGLLSFDEARVTVQHDLPAAG